MRKSDIGLYGMVSVLIAVGIISLILWQDEQEAWNLLSEEDQAMTQLAENLRKTSQTNCAELSQVFDLNTNVILLDAITMKQKELNCEVSTP
jgi:hypothetical protein